MERILVPTDFSTQAMYAFDLAAEFCSASGAELVLMHVADLPVASDPMGTNLHSYFSPELLSQLETSIDERLDEYLGKFPEVNVTSSVVWGNPFSGISRYIAENEVDLVIMGTKGASGIKEVFIGSNAEKVVRHSHCPVLCVKEPVAMGSLKNIVFGDELSFEQEKLVFHIKKLQDLLGAGLHIVRINTPSRFRRDAEIWGELKMFVMQHEFSNYTLNVFNDFHQDQGLIHFADQIGADMIALGTHGKRGLSNLLSDSVAEEIVNHARRPIWTYIAR